jgi:hypothetical protein
MAGKVVSYDSTNGSLVVSVDTVGPVTGTFTDWAIAVSGTPGLVYTDDQVRLLLAQALRRWPIYYSPTVGWPDRTPFMQNGVNVGVPTGFTGFVDWHCEPFPGAPDPSQAQMIIGDWIAYSET